MNRVQRTLLFVGMIVVLVAVGRAALPFRKDCGIAGRSAVRFQRTPVPIPDVATTIVTHVRAPDGVEVPIPPYTHIIDPAAPARADAVRQQDATIVSGNVCTVDARNRLFHDGTVEALALIGVVGGLVIFRTSHGGETDLSTAPPSQG